MSHTANAAVTPFPSSFALPFSRARGRAPPPSPTPMEDSADAPPPSLLTARALVPEFLAGVEGEAALLLATWAPDSAAIGEGS